MFIFERKKRRTKNQKTDKKTPRRKTDEKSHNKEKKDELVTMTRTLDDGGNMIDGKRERRKRQSSITHITILTIQVTRKRENRGRGKDRPSVQVIYGWRS